MRLPLGFRAGGIAAGLKRSGKPDLGAVVVDGPAVWAFAGTRNVVRAACVDRNRVQANSGRQVSALVVNSGQANCATGERGVWNNEDYAGLAAAALGLPGPNQVLTASTGVVGVQLPMATLREGLPRLAGALGERSTPFARAIVTTDSVTKQVAADLPGGGRIVGVAKGSGMIHPNMGTMFAFLFTDVAIGQENLRRIWSGAVDRTFNQVTVDGDTSPNDMAIVLSSNRVREDERLFAATLAQVCRKLARKIAADGEGASTLLSVRVEGARSPREARAAARTVAASPLVKTAVHGRDPNWGRILVALGRSGASFNPAAVAIRLQDTLVFEGEPVEFDEAALSRDLNRAEVRIGVDLAVGSHAGEAWGCDLSSEYVRINADYTT